MAEKKKALQINPLDITESLGYTTFRRDSRKPWTKEEDRRLSELVHGKLIELGYEEGIKSLNHNSWDVNQTQLPQEIDWEEIGEKLQTRKPKDCRKRWTNSLDPNLKKGKWTAQEDEKLLASYKIHGSSWQKISLDIPGRTDDQCAKRYIEVLDPNTKDRLRPWNLEEDLELIKKVKLYGTKWRTISLEMKSRPSLTCRNRWRKIVTDVVRGKALPEIKQALDSIQGGFSTLEKINENLERQRQTQMDTPNDELKGNAGVRNHHGDSFERSKSMKSQTNGTIPSLTSMASPSYSGALGESPKPHNTEIDWKYTLKDTSGLTLSNGNISTTDLAKQLIENAKRYDLKISIHQHIHHHYAPTGSLPKGASPVESTTSQNSGNPDDLVMPNRYSHFNYLPPMVQPQLESSNTITTKESDLARLLNPSGHHQQQQHYQHGNVKNGKRKLSGSSSNNSRSKQRPAVSSRHQPSTGFTDSHRKPSFNQDELEDELDFWETMRSLSQVVNNNNSNNIQSSSNMHRLPQTVPPRGNTPNGGANDLGLYYSVFGEDEEDIDDDEFKNDLKDIEGLAGILPFNPS
ncbi:hypothetical protein WICANDRAFT_76508 [Wickerhamomyces anomalus NRRL Y-366-8]|uniref:Uncharacterized protein n=1 Tax=Wickerhamomyces anomalus (strain ATCC 58044 / CBS 1984 / NCYC 433 / NRRL Y-366-8) TaxID=683960 RepID=A0A1E3PBT0_WICAA|nr:uncharacterized protein WICANDRAFT_76508 [Wickerhamomyces anomalus NRRL Y-366-8]ODQ62337.1 hypothetical protein WICANDRAFT_76508 [Wickerhamomyces anomalus NRRL Y-366-8]